MIYVFDHKIIFDSEESTLKKINDHEQVEIKLSAPAKRLLLTFILDNGQVLSKDFLLKKVWEEHNFAPTEANLNNNLSILRKSFAKLDSTKSYINTVPKMGFRLNAIINDDEGVDEKTPPATKKRTFKNPKMLIAALAIPVVVGIFLFNFIQSESAPLEIDHCKVYKENLLDNLDIQRVKDQINEQKIDCSTDKDIFYDDNGFSTNREEVLFISTCIYNNKDKNTYTSCKTIRNVNGDKK